MKARSIIFFATSMVVVASCTNKPGGSAGFGDNEYAVRTVSPESIELSTSYPATIRGVQDVEIKLYPESRHEILNDLDKEMVMNDVYNWIRKQMTKKCAE